jgi:hypothetical protein
MEEQEDSYNTDDPTGRYIHEPKWVEDLIESGENPAFETGDIVWFPVGVSDRWRDTLDEGTEYIGYSFQSTRGPNGHYYGWLAIGDPRSGGDVRCCTLLESSTKLGPEADDEDPPVTAITPGPIQFGWSEVACGVCGEHFEHDDRVFEVIDGSWEQEGPNFKGDPDQWRSVAWVHPKCLKHTTY